ncbi:MAG: LytTR family transcriptional regulator [Carboxylicivirga sp.]|nr:LytTR family transcriptional regulator [Carboxylicivirga sp.]
MKRLSDFFNRNFPCFDTWLKRVLHIFITLLICTFILFGLKAFNISSWLTIPGWMSFLGPHSFLLIGIGTFFVTQFILYVIFKSRDFKNKHLIAWLISELILISIIATLIYGNKEYPFLDEMLTTLRYTTFIMILPYTLSLLLLSSFFGNKTISEIKPEQVMVDLFHFTDEKNQTQMSIKPAHVLYLESSDNYVTIYYMDDGAVKKELVRNTLKRVESEFGDKGLMRCHRSFIINIQNIETIKKVSRSYQIKLKNTDTFIPVSKSFIPQVKELISQ